MTDQLRDIGSRLADLRDIRGLSEAEFAEKCGITIEQLGAYEKGENDFSFSFLSNAARTLGVDIVDIMSGDSSKLSGCCLTRKGQGYVIKREGAYSYRHLAFTFQNKLAEPFLVKVMPNEHFSVPEQHSHPGQEFNLIIEGRLGLFIDNLFYELNQGDSVYFDSSQKHAMMALDGQPARFLAVVMQTGPSNINELSGNPGAAVKKGDN